MKKKSASFDAERLLIELLAIPGRSGRERQVLDYIVGRLRGAGLPEEAIRFDRAHWRSVHEGEVGNLVCKLPGTVRAPRRLLMAHADTVPLCEGCRPVRRGRHLVAASKETGLGADDRAGCAVVLGAALQVLTQRLPHPPLTLMWTVQEELGLHGARHATLSLLGRPRLAFNFDGGTAEKLTVGATGGYRMDIRIVGRASHAGSRPEFGVSAITVASLAIADLHHHKWLGKIERGGQGGTSNIGVVRGGEATNVVTPEVLVRAEARSHHPGFRTRIVQAIERAFQRAARRVASVEGHRAAVEIDGRLDYESFRLDDDEPCIAEAERAVRSVGGRPERAVCNGGIDANWMTLRGIPTVTLGTGQENAHTTSERLDLREYGKAVRVALALATGEG